MVCMCVWCVPPMTTLSPWSARAPSLEGGFFLIPFLNAIDMHSLALKIYEISLQLHNLPTLRGAYFNQCQQNPSTFKYNHVQEMFCKYNYQ